MIVAQDQQGKLLNEIQFVRIERCEIEAASQVGVAVLVELHATIGTAGLDLDVDPREGLSGLLVCDTDLAVILDDLHVQGM